MNPRFRLSPSAALALLFATTIPFSLTAAPSPGASDTPAASAYTNQPTLPPPVPYIDSSSSNYNNYSGPSSSYYGSPFDNGFYAYVPQNYFYFPPAPPPLGAATPFRRSASFSTTTFAGGRLGHIAPITPQLSPYVGESFYPPLATHLHNEDLTKKQHLRLSTYRDTRADLLSALHAKLDALKDADAPTRLRELSAFAQEQAPRIDAFEQEAEAIREDLVHGGFFHSGVEWADWDANRSWRLGDDLRYESRIDEFKVIRAAAYFYPNLIPAQRRLLQELAMELNEPLSEPSADTALDAPDAYFYLSPETARVHLPRDLPDDLAGKIAAYQKEKSALKEELRSAIYKLDRSFFNFTRKNTLNPLAEQQAPRIAALESLAEEIRRGLAAQPNPNRLNRTKGSSEMAARIGSYTHDRQELLRAFQDKMTALRKQFPTARIEGMTRANASRITLIANRNQSRSEAQAMPAAQEELTRFNDDQSQKFAALDRAKSVLLADVRKAADTPPPDATKPAVDTVIRRFATEYRKYEILDMYGDYDYAVFEPGLSPGQRRLLYAAALQRLDLPIPGGSRQP